MNAVLRAKSIVTDPLSEWDRIALETDDAGSLLSRYVAPLAIIPSLFGFVGVSLIGVIARNGETLRLPIIDGLFGAVFGYVMACAIAVVAALCIYVLAPVFGGIRGFNNSFGLAAYSLTPVWLCGIFLLLPGLHFLALFGLYGLYLLWLGAPRLLKVTEQMALSFAITIGACAGAMIFAAATVQHMIFRTPGL